MYGVVGTVSGVVLPGGRLDVSGAGLVVPGYTVLGELGRGAGTAVFRVRRGSGDWAMKVRLGSDDGIAGFRREAALLALADHPNLPHVHDVGVAAGRPYLVMDLIAGQSLAS